MKPDLSVDIAGIRLKNPVMPASGTFEAKKMSGFIDLSRLGALITKTTTLEPRRGNDGSRMCETDAGMINRIGLQNPGVDVVIAETIPFLEKFDTPVIVSIGGRTVADYRGMARKLSEADLSIAAFEVNISCPNTEKGGMAFGQDPDIAFEVIKAVRMVTRPGIKIIAKLTPNVTDITVIAKAVVSAGAQAVSLINTFKAMARSNGELIIGGLSGPAIKSIALSMVYQVAQAEIGVPIFGIGGIRNTTDAIDFLQSGADAVQVGTANFVHPTTMVDIIDGLERYMIEKRYRTIQELRKGK